MGKSFSEKLNEIVGATASKTKGGKMKPTFSKKMFAEVTNALLNDPDYEVTTVQSKGDGFERITSKPVKEFREKLLQPILAEVKMDSADAAKFIENYEFTKGQTEMFYDVASAAITEYMKAGKTFRFPSTEDFTGSISIRHNEPSVYEHKTTGAKIQRGAYDSIVKKSNCPPWKKTKL